MARKKSKVKKEKVVPSPDLDPEKPEDLQALNEEAKAYYEDVVKPEQEEKEEKLVADFEDVIETEDKLLKMFSPDRFDLNVTYRGTVFKFKVKPIEPDDDLAILEVDSKIYADMSVEEKELLDKISKGEKLTKDDEKILAEWEKRSAKSRSSSELRRMHMVLAQHLTPPDFDGDIEKRKEFWVGVDFMFKSFVYMQTMTILGLNERNIVELFQGD